MSNEKELSIQVDPVKFEKIQAFIVAVELYVSEIEKAKDELRKQLEEIKS
jgi:hypothetical protein